MGQKVHPESLPCGVHPRLESNWLTSALADYSMRTRRFAGTSSVGSARRPIRHHPSARTRPRSRSTPHGSAGDRDRQVGLEVDQLRETCTGSRASRYKVNILEIKRPEPRCAPRRAVDRRASSRIASLPPRDEAALRSAMRSGARGSSPGIGRSGRRRDGAHEAYSDGRVPLHTLRADIDYGFHEARTTFAGLGSSAGSTRARSCRGLHRCRPDAHGRAPPQAPDEAAETAARVAMVAVGAVVPRTRRPWRCPGGRGGGLGGRGAAWRSWRRPGGRGGGPWSAVVAPWWLGPVTEEASRAVSREACEAPQATPRTSRRPRVARSGSSSVESASRRLTRLAHNRQMRPPNRDDAQRSSARQVWINVYPTSRSRRSPPTRGWVRKGNPEGGLQW